MPTLDLEPNELRDKIARKCTLEIEKQLETWCVNDKMGLLVVRKGTVYEHGIEAITAALDEYAKKFLDATLNWDRVNDRRIILIHKEIANQLSADETQELQELQALADFRVQLLIGNEEAERQRRELKGESP